MGKWFKKVTKFYNPKTYGFGKDSGGGPGTPFSWIDQSGYDQFFGQNADPASKIFSSFKENNPLATGVGKYSTGLLSLLATPEFQKLKDFESTPEWQRLEESMDPDFYIKKAAPGVEEAFGQARTRGRGALARGGLAGSGAEAALEERLGYGRAKAQGDITTAGEDYANQVAQYIFGARQKQLGDIQSFRKSVLDEIIGAATGGKMQSSGGTSFGDYASGAAGIAKLFL